MKKGRNFCLTMLVVASIAQIAVAAEQGTLRLLDLPENSYVYIDGVIVTPQQHGILVNPRQDVIHLSPGWHEIQVEQPIPVQAMRRLVEILPQQSTTVFVRPYMMPVLATGKTVSRNGGMGPPGPRNEPLHYPWQFPDLKSLPKLPPPTLANAKDELRGSVRAHVRAMGEQAEDYQAQVHASITTVPDAYWYDPDYQSVFDPQASPGPMGPYGPRGLLGPLPPIPPHRVLILLDEEGQPLLPTLVEQAKKQLGLQEISDNLKAAVQRASELRDKIPATAIPHLRRIHIYTPMLKEKLDQEKSKTLAAGLTRPPGRQGPQGPMFPPASASWPEITVHEEYKLSEVQIKQVMEMLRQDEYLKRQIERLRWFEEDLEIWLAEGEQRVAPQ